MQWHKKPGNKTGYWTASLDSSQEFDVVVDGHSTLLDIMYTVFVRYFHLKNNPTAGVPNLMSAGGSSRRKKTKKRRTKRTIKRRKTKRK